MTARPRHLIDKRALILSCASGASVCVPMQSLGLQHAAGWTVH